MSSADVLDQKTSFPTLVMDIAPSPVRQRALRALGITGNNITCDEESQAMPSSAICGPAQRIVNAL